MRATDVYWLCWVEASGLLPGPNSFKMNNQLH
jgi:hypothetical protein